MQLNGLDGSIIIIDQIDSNTGRTVYSVYENIIYNADKTVKTTYLKAQDVKMLIVDLTPLADATLTVEDNISKLYYQALATQFTGFSISNDKQNWLYPAKPLRIIVDNIEHIKQMTINPAYKALMNEMLVRHPGYIETYGFNSVMYVDALNPVNMAVVAPFVDVWIFTEAKFL